MQELFFLLLKAALFGETIDEEQKQRVTSECLLSLFKLARRHNLAHLICQALHQNGLLPEGEEIASAFVRERNVAIYRYGQLQYEYEQICRVLNEAGIAFLPLKGNVIRELYPEPWMRTSCDIDILIPEEKLSQSIELLQSKLGYSHEGTGNHNANLFAPSGMHLELHFRLSSERDKWHVVLEDIWSYAQPTESCRYELSQELFYFYHIAHMAGHFQYGGCGVRYFIDLYLLRKKYTYDEERLAKLFEGGGLTAFHRAVTTVMKCWFGNGERTELVTEVENFVLFADMYGDMPNRVALTMAKKGGRWKFLRYRIFLPYNRLKFQYPRLEKYPILYPFYQVKRWFRLLKKTNRRRSVEEFKETTFGDKEKQQRLAKLLQELDV